MYETTVIAAAGAGLFAGVMGGTHCAAMCGGIAGALPLGTAGAAKTVLPPDSALSRGNLLRALAFNAGRILSYTLAGALAGGIGSAAFVMQDMLPVREALFVAANLMLIALGLYLAGIWQGLTLLERGGAVLWRRIQPFAARYLISPSLRHTLLLGALWGWIPCGLVYSMLVTALASGGSGNGALIMFSFGIGTLPNLLLLGFAAGRLSRYFHERAVRVTAGIAVAAFGVLGIARLPQLDLPGAWGRFCHTAMTALPAWFGA
jgi:hypothetical protein